ncbi:abortive infection protein [Leptolyngbya sp. Heron Island J]|uniref:CPBP family intramembrane glutamic endopeptidase n=1 Tax=Leptolyngbya sp. Heron Island J TaxID=1385935 RepID=UPI0003B944B0|nr:type II CAAX endopeptidase family protein [Leptolyngbya sp. Heron Island J]ESA32381.1 abortive infection protein [Leptolyngbya sp. Heron Island J]
MGRNPFEVLKFRTHVLVAFIISNLLVGIVYGVLEYQQLLPWPLSDRLWMPIQFMIIFGLVCGVLLTTGRRAGLRLTRVFGPPPRFPWAYGILLIASMLIFSFSSFLLLFYPISLFAPGFVEERLTEQLLNVETAAPELYRYLMLFVVLVFAPITEEFVFRGVLLQRWAVRWNLPVGVIMSSVLFGMLHINNPMGLTMFGVIMALLYIRTRSLWVPIIAHALNNVVSVTPELFSTSSQTFNIEDFQQTWWIGLVGVCLAAPTLGHFIYKSWPQKNTQPPYFRE